MPNRRPDFTDRSYDGEHDYLVFLTNDGYNVWEVTAGFIWDDATNDVLAHPELGAAIETIKERYGAYMKTVMDEDEDD